MQNDELMNNEHLEYLEYVATGYSDLTRGVDNVLLADYPGGTYSYWFTELEPVAGYVYMWPWTAEVAIDDVLNELKEPGVNAIVSIKAIKVWGKYDTGKYLEPLQTFLDNNFVKLDNDIYVSRSLCETNKLANRCKNPDNFQSTRLMQK